MTRRDLLRLAVASIAGKPVHWMKLDLMRGTQTQDWPDADRPIGFGSLLKPFLGLAYSATHEHFPVLFCRGRVDRCWSTHGHGEQDIVHALANSCNAYFLKLEIDRAALDAVCLSFGLTPPERTRAAAQLIGLGEGWSNTPAAVLNAFGKLAHERKAETVLRGMALAPSKGTAKLLATPCYAKTGTTPCSHVPRAMGDGVVAVLYPSPQPRTVLLVQHHGTTGAETCRDARRLL